MSQTVIGIFDNANEAQNAVQQLVTTGFTRDNIDISTQNISNQNTTTRDDDSIGGFFNSLFGGNDEARTYSHVARQGSVVTLQTRSREEAVRAAEILDRNGAVDVDRKAAETGFTNSGGQAFGETTNRAIPIIEENLEIGKREVETGGVRLRSRIVERPVEEHLRLREEHVNIERNAVNRPATDADINTFREGTIELTEHAEVPW